MNDQYGTTSLESLGLNLSSAAMSCLQEQVGGANELAILGRTLCKQFQQDQQQVATTTTTTNQLISEAPLTKLLYGHLYEPTRAIDRYLDYYLSDFWHTGDPRTRDLPFMSGGPWKIILATACYLYLIKRLLPNAMRNRKPFELNWFIRCYNLFMVISNLYAVYHASRILLFGVRCFGCEIIDQQDKRPEMMELLHFGWLYFISRLIEWLDTIFFVLRKKDRQVTKLHVFHHSFVPIFVWVYLKFYPGYTVAFFPYINSFVHTVMYTYYFLATFGPKLQPYLWWKRHLTSLQIAQFVLILIQLATIPLGISDRCQYSRSFLLGAISGASLFLWLFYTYYMDTYRNQNKLAANRKPEREVSNKGLISSNDGFLINQREGSSRALSDTIEEVLLNEPHVETTTTYHRRPQVSTTTTKID